MDHPGTDRHAVSARWLLTEWRTLLPCGAGLITVACVAVIVFMLSRRSWK